MKRARLLILGCAIALTMALAPNALGETHTNTFSSAGPVNVPATGGSGPAQAFPWRLGVKDLEGKTTRVTVTLYGLVHSRVSDLDALLVGPTAAHKVLFMSDIGDATPIAAPGVTVSFDDSNPLSAPVGTPLLSGNYKPTNANGGDGDVFPGPAPSGPYFENLAEFNGRSPEGNWDLYLNDDDGIGIDAGTGSVQAWSLGITTQDAAGAGGTGKSSGCRKRRGHHRRVRCRCRRQASFAARHHRKCKRALHARRR